MDHSEIITNETALFSGVGLFADCSKRQAVVGAAIGTGQDMTIPPAARPTLMDQRHFRMVLPFFGFAMQRGTFDA